MSTLVLMCGLSFAGKSTLAHLLAEQLPATYTSLDLMNAERGLDGGQGIPLEEWATTNRIAHDRVASLLADGQDVVVDDTGSPRFIRDDWRGVATSVGAAFVVVWVRIDAELQRERVRANRASAARNDVVDAVLADHAAAFEPPTEEPAVEVDARDTRDPARVSEAVAAVRAAGADPQLRTIV